MRMFGPYYYGKNKWDNYLLDIQDTIKAGDDAHQQRMREQAEAFGTAHQEQLEALRQQTEQMRRIEDALQGGFEELRAEFEWGFSLMVDRMDTQIDHLSQIAARLDAIHKTLQSPLLTQARELFQLGQEHFRKGLLDKALAAYLKAEEKNEVDFPLQLQIGKLYLYGRDEDDDVIDLPNAEKHLLLAARYADAEKATFSQWNEYCGQAHFHAAVAAYLIGEKEQAAGNLDSMRGCLGRALVYLGKAAVLWPRFTEIVYTQAKCHALLGQIQDATQKLEILSDRDRRYFAKASQDGDFNRFSAQVEDLFKRAAAAPGPLARATEAKTDEVGEAVAWAKRSALRASKDIATIESIQRELVTAKQTIPTLDVDIETLSEDLDQWRATLEKITLAALNANIDSSLKAISECEGRKGSCEYAIEQLKATMKQTSGTGMGCLFAALVVFIVMPVGMSVFVSTLPPQMQTDRSLIQSLTSLVGGIFVWIVGAKLWRDHKNQPHRQKMQEHFGTVQECVSALPTLRERWEGWKRELQSFEAWRTQRPSPPPIPRPSRSGTLTITLISAGADKINVIKAIREVTGFELKQAKDLIDNPPAVIRRDLSREDADMIQRKFAQVGTRVEIS